MRNKRLLIVQDSFLTISCQIVLKARLILRQKNNLELISEEIQRRQHTLLSMWQKLRTKLISVYICMNNNLCIIRYQANSSCVQPWLQVWCRVTPDKLMVANMVKKFPMFMTTRCLLAYSPNYDTVMHTMSKMSVFCTLQFFFSIGE